MSARKSRAPAGRIAYVDGRYVPHGEASVHVEDRGLQFADSIYEVFAVAGGRILDEAGHLDRLERSLAALAMAMPKGRAALALTLREMLRRNRLADGLLYLQVTRGAQRRDHPVPAVPAAARPTLILTARGLDPASIVRHRAAGVAVVTRPDIRWGRCDIKTTGLLANVMAKTEARAAGAYEAWLVDEDGFVTEGASTNAWIVAGGMLVTRALSAHILAGVTRAALLSLLAENGLSASERAFTPEEARGADEAFFTSATGGVMPVIAIDGHRIGAGRPGPLTLKLADLYAQESGNQARSFSLRNCEKGL